MVRVELTDSVQMTAHFSVSVADFYSNNLGTVLIDRMCALLQIADTSRLKIVGII